MTTTWLVQMHQFSAGAICAEQQNRTHPFRDEATKGIIIADHLDFLARSRVVDLSAHLTALVGPGEVGDGDYEEAVIALE